MYSGCDMLSLQILFVYFLALPSLLDESDSWICSSGWLSWWKNATMLSTEVLAGRMLLLTKMCVTIGSSGHFSQSWVGTVGGIKTVTFPSRPVPFKRKRVPIPFNKKRELNGRWSRRQMVGPTSQTVASSNYTPGVQESRKEYYFSRSASAIWIDQR